MIEETLAEKCLRVSEAMFETLTDEVKQKTNQAMQQLLASDVGDQAKTTGDQLPTFILPNVKGEQVNIMDQINTGPVVLSFYRGGWCPYCHLEFDALLQCLPDITRLGGQLIGISPETPDAANETVSKHGLKFEVLSDLGNVVARQFGLVMTVSEEMRALYLQWGMDLPTVNGDRSWELPLPATYIMDSQGLIRAAYVNKDYTRRMEPSAIIEALQGCIR